MCEASRPGELVMGIRTFDVVFIQDLAEAIIGLLCSGTLKLFACRVAQHTPDETAQHQLLKQDMDNALLTLTSRECGVLRLRYGLDDGEEKTLEEIGQRFQASPEPPSALPPSSEDLQGIHSTGLMLTRLVESFR